MMENDEVNRIMNYSRSESFEKLECERNLFGKNRRNASKDLAASAARAEEEEKIKRNMKESILHNFSSSKSIAKKYSMSLESKNEKLSNNKASLRFSGFSSGNSNLSILSNHAKQERDVYEYIPDNLSSNISYNNLYENEDENSAGNLISAYARQKRSMYAEIEEKSIDASAAYEKFRGKTYKSTNYDRGFTINAFLRQRTIGGAIDKSELEVMPSFVLSSRHLCSEHTTYKENEAFKKKLVSVMDMDILQQDHDEVTTAFMMSKGEAMRRFETPLGRLFRLENELNEFESFVISYMQQEELKAERNNQEKNVNISDKELTLNNTRLLFGHNPALLLKEIDILKSQIKALSNNPDIQKLFANVDPINTYSCYDLVKKHLDYATEKLKEDMFEENSIDLSVSSNVNNSEKREISPLMCDNHSSLIIEEDNEKNNVYKTEMKLSPSDYAEFGVSDLKRKLDNESLESKKADNSNLARKDDNKVANAVLAKNKVSYELYTVPSVSTLLETCRISVLEKRISEIEDKIGLSKMIILPFNDIQSGLAELNEKLSFLDAQKIEHIGKRVQSLMSDLQSLQIKKELSGISVEDEKVESLYDLCVKWKKITCCLPIVLKRLKSLKTLHHEAGGIAMRIKVLENQQKDLSQMLEKTTMNFCNLERIIKENFEWSKRTVDDFGLRIKEVKSSVGNFKDANDNASLQKNDKNIHF